MNRSLTGLDDATNKPMGLDAFVAHKEDPNENSTNGTLEQRWRAFWENGYTVCPLGKLGAFTIFVWLLLSAIILMIVRAKPACIAVGITGLVLFASVFVLSKLMNESLFYRSFPFLLFQFGICIMLISTA